MKRVLSILILLVILPQMTYGEFRAYLLEIFDHIDKKKWDARTGFSPSKYILTHGGGNRLTVFMKATWMCWGDTGQYQPVCSMPKPKKPKFSNGDRVKIKLKRHITQGWIGTVELSYYQASVKSNVYGVRFGDKRQLYNRYFEFDLQKVVDSKSRISGTVKVKVQQ